MSDSYSDISNLNERLQKEAVQNKGKTDYTRIKGGWLGVVIGVGSDSRYNIIGVTIIVLIVASTILTFHSISKFQQPEYTYFQIATPLISGALGYMFGQKSKNDE